MFVGVVAFADDLVLIAPNRSSAQIMLKICEDYAEENNIKFSSHVDPNKSKSKSLYVTGRKGSDPPVPLQLCGKNLPWVDHCNHLGHTLTVTCTMEDDCKQKRAEFIDSAVKVRESFDFAHPSEILNATAKY